MLLVRELKDRLESLVDESGAGGGQVSSGGLDLELTLETILGMRVAEDHLLIESMLALLAAQVKLALRWEGLLDSGAQLVAD